MLSTIALASLLSVAAQGPSTWIVLIKSDGSVPSSWSDTLQGAVKDAAASTSDVKWLPPPQVSLDDAQLALGCSSWDNNCVGQIAGMMNADAALLLTLEKRGGGAWLKVSVVNNNGKARGADKKYELPDRGRDGLKVARIAAASAVTNNPVTIVTFTTDVAGAEVFVDGEKQGKTPLTLAGELSPGPHKVEFKLEGRAPVTQNVTVAEGNVTKVGAVLTSTGTAASDPGMNDPAGNDPDVAASDPQPRPLGEDPPAAAGGLDPLYGYITLGAAAAISVVGFALYGAHLYVGLEAQPKPCTNAADLELPPESRTCESQQEAFDRIERDSESVGNTMNALYWSFIGAEVVAAVVAVAGVGLVAAAFLLEEE